MPNKSLIILLSALCCLLSHFAFAQTTSEEITITTYYPSPYGVYNEMRLYPHSPATTSCDSTQEGLMYYDSVSHNLMVCRDNGATYAWESTGGGYWVTVGNDIYNANTGNVGIGTNSPTEVFQVCVGSVCTSVKQTTGNYGADVYDSWIYDNMLIWETCNDSVNPYTCEPDTFKNCRDYAQDPNCPNAWSMCARNVDCKKEGGLSWVDSPMSILQD